VREEAKPEEPTETHRDPSDAELFDSANVAFESGDFEKSKTELTALLERQPDFTAARELLGRVERALAPRPRVAEETRPSRKEAGKPPEPQPVVPPVAVSRSSPAELFESARSAFERSELEKAQAQLAALEAVDPVYPGASRLRGEIALELWKRKLPLDFNVRHDHALGSCTGVLQLTATGFHYRSKEHEWIWSFADVRETERRAPTRLRIETTKETSYNFELQSPPNEEDWSRHQALWHR
jgi:predicted Zn-dependent protease